MTSQILTLVLIYNASRLLTVLPASHSFHPGLQGGYATGRLLPGEGEGGRRAQRRGVGVRVRLLAGRSLGRAQRHASVLVRVYALAEVDRVSGKKYVIRLQDCKVAVMAISIRI